MLDDALRLLRGFKILSLKWGVKVVTIKKCAPRCAQLREAHAPLTVSQWVSKLQSCSQSKLYTLSVLVGPHTVLRVWTAYTMLIEHSGSEMSLCIQSFLHCIAGLFKTPSGPAHAPVLLASLNRVWRSSGLDKHVTRLKPAELAVWCTVRCFPYFDSYEKYCGSVKVKHGWW